MENTHVFVLSCKCKHESTKQHESTKHACFYVNFHLVPTFTPLHRNGKGLLKLELRTLVNRSVLSMFEALSKKSDNTHYSISAG